MSAANKQKGDKAEDAAADFLAGRGYKILARNYRAGRMGEIDIIALKDGAVAFVEVKYRSGRAYGTPAEAVTPSKIRKIKLAALRFAADRNDPNESYRFDIIEVSGRREFSLNHIEAAFGMESW